VGQNSPIGGVLSGKFGPTMTGGLRHATTGGDSFTSGWVGARSPPQWPDGETGSCFRFDILRLFRGLRSTIRCRGVAGQVRDPARRVRYAIRRGGSGVTAIPVRDDPGQGVVIVAMARSGSQWARIEVISPFRHTELCVGMHDRLARYIRLGLLTAIQRTGTDSIGRTSTI